MRSGPVRADTKDKDDTESEMKGNIRKKANSFRVVLARWLNGCDQSDRDKLSQEIDNLILPSNEEWRHRVYYRLVQLQRDYCNNGSTTNRVGEAKMDPDKKYSGWEWEAEIRGGLEIKAKGRSGACVSDQSLTSIDGSMTEACVQPGWRVNDIPLAAKVLDQDLPSPTYANEAEMRRVFGLVYDVLRFKQIFIRALEDTGFWHRNVAFKNREKIVWLLLYDMQGRKFARRGHSVIAVKQREKVFKAAGLMDIESALLEVKTHLAASISRLRIRGSALRFEELLPRRLRIIEGVAWDKEVSTIASGWVNTKKIATKKEFHDEMSKLKLVFREDKREEGKGNGKVTVLEKDGYTFDPICPKMINLHESAREQLAESSLACEHRFVFLERSLCLGAAALVRAIRVGHFCGPIVLTHCLAPRHTGYLAGLLEDVQEAGSLLAFGAGERRCEYESYLRDLGITLQRCRVFSEKYVSPPATAELDRATVVLAIPPCSYSGVRDVVDLAVARGGDLNLLESLTNFSIIGDDRSIEEPRALLLDQLSTLKYALTRPNVQFLIYEAHTILTSETTAMIRQVVDYANGMAAEKYIREHRSKRAPKDFTKTDHPQAGERDSIVSENVKIPDSDLFELVNIDDIYGTDISHALDPGCFLAVVKRKEMSQFDSLFMIKVAESKGLFGNSKKQGETKRESFLFDQSSRQSFPNHSQSSKQTKYAKIKIERIMAPTISSLSKCTKEIQICPRQLQHRSGWNEAFESQVSENVDANRNTVMRTTNSACPSKGWPRRKSSVKNVTAPIRAKSFLLTAPNKAGISVPRVKLDKLKVKKTSKPRKESSFVLTDDLLNIQQIFTREEWKCAVPSSTVLRSPILARALRHISLENDMDVNEEGDSSREPSKTQRIARFLYHDQPSAPTVD